MNKLPILLVLLISSVLQGCGAVGHARAKAALDSQLGQPVTNIVGFSGPPTEKIPLGNNTVMFQWLHYGSAQRAGTMSNLGGTLVYTAPQGYTTECRLSITAHTNKSNPTYNDWIITNWRYAGNGC